MEILIWTRFTSADIFFRIVNLIHMLFFYCSRWTNFQYYRLLFSVYVCEMNDGGNILNFTQNVLYCIGPELNEERIVSIVYVDAIPQFVS